MSQLNEEFSDTLDEINDNLTDLTLDEVVGIEGVSDTIGKIDARLNQNNLKLDWDEVEALIDEWEVPDEFEAINILLPVYDENNEQTEYNLSLTYAISDSGDQSYTLDVEVQYEWEADDEIATEYIPLDSQADYS